MAITPIYDHYIIDMSSDNNFVQIPTMQGDGNGVRGAELELISNGVPYEVDPNISIVSIMGSKSDTKHILNECNVTEEGYILVDITSQMSAVKGWGDYCIVLMDKTTNSQIKSFPFHILTTSAPVNISEIVSSDEFQLLEKRIFEAEEVIEEGKEVIADMRELEETVTKNEEARVEAENKRIEAENIRISNEEKRIDDENIRNANELVRIANEEERVVSEGDRNIAESKRVEAETIREENEEKRQDTFNSFMETANSEVERLQKENDTASASAELAKEYMESAKASKNTATEQATIATNAANSAEDSKEVVIAKTEETLGYSNLAKSYAVGTNDEIRNNDSVDNAKYYYEQVKGISEGLNGTLLPNGTITFADLENQAKKSGYMYNISDSFITTSSFKEGAGYSYPEGTNVYWTADGYWDCLAGTMVTSVNGQKGDIWLEIISDTEPTKQEIGNYWIIETTL